jgi:GNAT superfamily N-acetyltransferase
MFFRQTQTQFEQQKGEANRQALRAIVVRGAVPGILAYQGGKPVGWCAVAPRSEYSRLARSRLFQPLDDQPVWSIVCFFIARTHRRKGLTVALLGAAIDYARQQGARILEGYPVDPSSTSSPDVFAYTGTLSAFRRAGFQEVARRSPTRPIMRYLVKEE